MEIWGFILFRPASMVAAKKTFCYSNVFSYNHLYQPERFYEKRYKYRNQALSIAWRYSWKRKEK